MKPGFVKIQNTFNASGHWTPSTLTVEDAAPTHVLMTGLVANTTAVAGDFTVTGITATVNSISRNGTNKIITATLNVNANYGDVFSIVYKGKSYPVTNNVTYSTTIKTLFLGNIIGFWTLQETTGTTVTDVVNGNNGSYAGTFTLNQAGVFGERSVDFNESGYISLYSAGLAAAFNSQEGYLSLWIKAKDNSNGWGSSLKSVFNLGVDANNYIRASTYTTNGFNFKYTAGGTANTTSTGEPYGTRMVNIGLRWSKTTNLLELFINGVKNGKNTTVTGTWAGALTNNYSKVMANQSGTYMCFPALASDVLLLNYAPTDAKILLSVNPNGIVCFEGDSRTQARPWTGQALENACFALQPTNGFAFNKRGYDISAIGGSVVSAMAARAAVVNAKIISGYTNYLCVWIGYNNAAVSTTQQIFDAIKAYCIAAKAAGWSKIVLCTEIDAVTTGWTAKYQALNVLIKADNSFYDVLADLGARAELQDNTNLTYYSADHIHPNDVGFDIVRGVVQAALQTLSL